MTLLRKLSSEMTSLSVLDTPPVSASSPSLSFRDLTTRAGASRFTKALDGDRHIAREIRDLAKSYLEEYPELASVEVGKVGPGQDNFNWGEARIGVSTASPDILSHEAAHAGTLQDESLYRKILKLSKGAVYLNNIAVLPAILSIKQFIKDPEKQDNILKALAGFSAVAAAPNILEEARASARAIAKTENKMRALGKLGPGFISHALYGSVAPSAYYLASKDFSR